MNRLISALGAIALACAALGCGGSTGSSSSSGAPVANGCYLGSHMENGHCVDDRLCNGVPCADGGSADGGRLDDGGGSADSGSGSSGSLQCQEFCYMLDANQYQKVNTDAGVVFRFANGSPLPSGMGVQLYEVPVWDPRALKVCFDPGNDADSDGVPNSQDNCWLHENERPTCTSDDGCRKAGGHCLPAVDGGLRLCSGQIDPNGNGRGVPCQQSPDERDPDCDNDGIRIGQDVCPETGTSEAENVLSSCM